MDAYRYTLYLLQEPVSFTLHCSTAFWLMSLIVDMVGVGVVCKVGVVGVMGDVGVVGVVGWTAKLRKLLQALEAAAETAAGCREAAAAAD